ncbi:MAG: aminotransferase class IV [Armatimonadota bacterium]
MPLRAEAPTATGSTTGTGDSCQAIRFASRPPIWGSFWGTRHSKRPAPTATCRSIWTGTFFVTQGVLVTPPDDAVLGGITRRVLLQLAPQIGLNVECRPVHIKEARAVDEAFVTSTGPAVLPVRLLDGQPLAPIPGPATKRLTAAFSDYVGMDIVLAALAHV